MSKREGYVKVLGYNLFYRVFGEQKKGTVLCLHGGPGATHDYLLPLADLAEAGYRVVFYDQLGCGRSELPKNQALFVVERYVEEVEGVRKALKLGKVHLFGSSWGGMLAIAYALEYQGNIKSLITVGGLHNVMMTCDEMQRMKERLPRNVYETILKYEKEGEYDNKEYLKAVETFYRKHLCRLGEWPDELKYSIEHISRPVYSTMNGPNEFTIVGNIRYWDVTDKLNRIRVPMLIISGKYDEVSPKVARDIHRHVPGSELLIFKKSSHTPFWEQRKEFIEKVSEFLGRLK